MGGLLSNSDFMDMLRQWGMRDLLPIERAVYLLLLLHRNNKTGTAWPAITTIRDYVYGYKSRTTTSHVWESINILIDKRRIARVGVVRRGVVEWGFFDRFGVLHGRRCDESTADSLESTADSDLRPPRTQPAPATGAQPEDQNQPDFTIPVEKKNEPPAGNPEPARTTTYSEPFARWWKAFPRCASKDASSRKICYPIWVRLQLDQRIDEIMAGMEHWLISRSWKTGFAKSPAWWLENEKWLEQPSDPDFDPTDPMSEPPQ